METDFNLCGRSALQERQLQREAESWERTLQCSPLPDISDAPGLHAYFAEATSRQHKDITSVLHTCQVCTKSSVCALTRTMLAFRHECSIS